MPRKKVEKVDPVVVKAKSEWWGVDPWGNELGEWFYFRPSRSSQLHGFYCLRRKVGGKTQKASTGFSDYPNALKKYHEICALWNTQGESWAPKKRSLSGTLSAYWVKFRAVWVVGKKSPYKASDPKNPSYPCDTHIAALLRDHGTKQMTEFTPTFCKVWAAGRVGAAYFGKHYQAKKGGMSEGTVFTEVSVVKRVFEQAVYDEVLSANPWKAVKGLKPSKGRKRVVTEEEEVKLAAVLTPFYYRWYRSLVGSGLRITEHCEIDVKKDLHLVEGEEFVRVTRKSEGAEAKDKVVQEVPLIDADAIAAFKEQLEADGKLWGMSQTAYKEMLAVACEKAGIEHITPHTLRHTFVTRYLKAGGDINIAAGIVGHSTASMTQRYAHLLSKDLRELSKDVKLRKRPVATGERVVPFKKKA